MGNPKLIALPPYEKSVSRMQIEDRIADFMGYIEEVNALGKQIGRSCLAMDIMQGLMSMVCYADNPEFRKITGIAPTSHVQQGTRTK